MILHLVCNWLILISGVHSANVLYIAPLSSPSHYIWNKELSMELVKNGHNVTIITHDYDTSNDSKNYSVITMEGFYDNLKIRTLLEEFVLNSGILKTMQFMSAYVENVCEHDFNTNGFKILMNYPKTFKFDLIIFDITYTVCLYGLIPKFHNPPVVGVSAFPLTPHMSHSFGTPLYTSYIPYHLTKYTNQMNFKERLMNLIYTWLHVITFKYITNPIQNKYTKRVFGESAITTLEQIERNISLFLVNIDPVFDYPVALPPNVIPVGGLHIKPGKPLPEEFELIYNQAEYGIILFSMGTNIDSGIFNENGIALLLSVFAKLQQVVIWKTDGGEPKNLPKNVIIKKWLPQNDMLANPKTKLFITHCGALGTQEAMYHGVPMLGFPIFLDQNVNAAKLVQKQIGIYLDHKNLIFRDVYDTIIELIRNPIYKRNVMKISERYRSSYQTARERATFWIEHVLKYGNADYLNIPARDMYTYEILNLDAAAYVIITLIVVYAIIKAIIKLIIYRRTLSNRKNIKQKVT